MIKELLKRPIAYNPIVAKAFGSVKLGILWSQMYYWSERTNDEDGWVYKTQNDLFEETGLSRKEQETARKLGKKIGVLESQVMGVPPKVNFRVDLEKTEEIIKDYISKIIDKEKKKSGLIVNQDNVAEVIGGIQKAIKPGIFNKRFFEDVKCMMVDGGLKVEKLDSPVIDIRDWAESKGIKMSMKDVSDFVLYWTEPNKSGTKEKWEMQKTFDVRRRLLKWLDNKAKWSPATKGKKTLSI